jgi:hypothetical protein
MQRIVQSDEDSTKLYIFIKSTLNNDIDMRTIIFDERHNPSLFDLNNGRVFRVHVVVHHNGDPDLLQPGDFLIINFHQSAFDKLSLDIFHRDLCMAYECETALSYCNNELRYIDCKLKTLCFYVFYPYLLNLACTDAVAEEQMPKKVASAFWCEMMFDYDWNRHLDLPIDQQRQFDERRISSAYSSSFKFDDDVAEMLMDYASVANIPLMPIFLTCYYVFLFKFAKNETDLCVGMNVTSRYRPELKNIIGTFVNL